MDISNKTTEQVVLSAVSVRKFLGLLERIGLGLSPKPISTIIKFSDICYKVIESLLLSTWRSF
jgi:hypothetical protein